MLRKYLGMGAFGTLFGLLSIPGHAQQQQPLYDLATKQQAAYLETLKDLVNFETGSGDVEGLDKIADYVAQRMKKLGGTVEVIDANTSKYMMADTPQQIGKIVQGTFTGTGTGKVLLIAHMDTVYKKGMLAKQPFRIEGDRAYGLGIADDKQGVALILHTLTLLKQADFRNFGQITVMFNGDEEISSPGSRKYLTTAGKAHNATLSYEATRVESDKISLATSGIAAAILAVEGRASHAGASPEKGVNALYEMAHQVLQASDLSEPEKGLKLNWTLASAGNTRNVIPANATAEADVRVLRVADYDQIEKKLRERITHQLLPESKVSLVFERRRPPLEPKASSRKLAQIAQGIYQQELGKTLAIDDQPEGGGTDAAFAGLETDNPVLERLGIQGFGAHSNNDEYVLLESIVPRLYLSARLVMAVGQGNTPK